MLEVLDGTPSSSRARADDIAGAAGVRQGLTAVGLTKRYGDRVAVDGVELTVPRGAIHGLLGPNGAGKTSTVRMLLGITLPDAGDVRWDGVRVGDLDRTHVGYLPEERGLYPDMNVHEQLVFFGRLHGLGRRPASACADAWIERLSIGEYRNSRVDQLSKGNQQKVQLGAALMHSPSFAILDEPFTGLDPINNDLVERTVKELSAGGMTIVLSTHDMEQVEDLCDAVTLLYRGRVLLSGSVDEVKRPYAERTRSFSLTIDGAPDALLEAFPGASVERRFPTVLTFPGDVYDRSEVLSTAVRTVSVEQFSMCGSSLRDVFVAEVGAHGA